MTPEEYKAKREARYLRLLAAADRAASEGDARRKTGDDMFNAIPFAQPILIGHHSEKRDRRYRERAWGNLRKGYDLHQKAERLRRRAEAARSNRAIFSDDPAAVDKLEAKIARLEKRQEMMKAANKLVRKEDREALLDMGFSEHVVAQLFTPDFMGRLGFPNYEITNNGANLRRLKKRVGTIVSKANDVTSEEKIGDVTITDNVKENRLQIFFSSKPDSAVRTALKARGFRWSPTIGAWQRHRSSDAAYWAKKIVEGHCGGVAS